MVLILIGAIVIGVGLISLLGAEFLSRRSADRFVKALQEKQRKEETER